MRIVLLGILILVPLGVALLLLLGTMIGLANGEGGADLVVGATFFAGLGAVLIWAARRILTRKGSLLAVPSAEAVNPRLQCFLTSYVLFLVYLVLAGYAFVVLNINSVRNWLGVALLILAGATLESALGDVRRLRHDRRENASPGGRAPAMRGFLADALAATLQDRVWLLIGVAGLSMSAVFYYRYWGGSRYLGPLDLTGFLGLALAFAIATILRGSAQEGSMEAPQAEPASRQKPENSTGK